MIFVSPRLVISTLTILVATTAFAQGRHDEKPHGSTKPSMEESTERKSVPMVGGRHDERPHGIPKKAKSQKPSAIDDKDTGATGKGAK